MTCPEIITYVDRLVLVPAELSETHPNPAVPMTGDNAALLEWAQACATNNRLYEEQSKALRELE